MFLILQKALKRLKDKKIPVLYNLFLNHHCTVLHNYPFGKATISQYVRSYHWDLSLNTAWLGSCFTKGQAEGI